MLPGGLPTPTLRRILTRSAAARTCAQLGRGRRIVGKQLLDGDGHEAASFELRKDEELERLDRLAAVLVKQDDRSPGGSRAAPSAGSL